jgi:REP element-mobilizing transposase RayT
MDILDFLENKEGYFSKGYYRKYKDSDPKFFTYKIITNTNERFDALINNLMTVNNSVVIQTPFNIDFEINGFVTLQDGNLYLIETIQKDVKNSRALIFFKDSAKTEYILGLIKQDNPMGIV